MSKDYIRDPEILISQVYDSIQSIQDSRQNSSTAEWEARNGDNIIGASQFSMCTRQSYYTYFTPDKKSLERTFNPVIKEWMYLGLLCEELLGEFLDKEVPAKKIHIEQNDFPVHMKSPNSTDKIIWAATTDFVPEFELDGKSYYIPIELKSTQLKKWDEFRYHPYHLRQLLTWIYNGKEQDLNIPFGLLVYVGDLWNRYKKHEIKITCIQVDTKFKKISKTIIEDWDVHKFAIEDRRAKLKEAIENTQLPEFPQDVPNYICTDCVFKNSCFANTNIPEIQGMSYEKTKDTN